MTEPLLSRPLARKPSRSAEVSLEGLHELARDDGCRPVQAAAQEALRCVEQAGADPRLMLLVVEKVMESSALVDQQEYDRQRYAQGSAPDSKTVLLIACNHKGGA